MDRLQNLRRRSSGGGDDDDSDGDGRRPDPATSRVKRALFGPVNHEENLRFVRQELERGRREASSRWNYDFENDRPREGRYQWERTSATAAATSATTSGTTGRALLPEETEADRSKAQECDTREEEQKRPPASSTQERSQRQTSVTGRTCVPSIRYPLVTT